MPTLSFTRHLVTEITRLAPDIYRTLEQELLASKWWEESNEYEDVIHDASPLSLSLETAVNSGLTNAGIDAYAKVRVIKRSFLQPEDHSILAYATSAWDSKLNKEVVGLTLHCGNVEELGDFSSNDACEEISEVIRHELIHGQQLSKQATNKNVTMAKADKLRGKDPRQIYTGEDQSEYFALHNEIDAFAHQTAEELLRRYGKDKALRVLSMTQDNDQLPIDVKQMAPMMHLKDTKSRAKFKSRIYAYLEELGV